MIKHRVGVIGAGGIGNKHVSGLVDFDHVELVSACDISEETLNEFKEKWESTWPNISLYTNYTQMLKQENLDIVNKYYSEKKIIFICGMPRSGTT